ncbi:D-alanine--poly(phosphoribitol) ligase subunit DltA [Macrococcoides canis]|uniref:D-alanine--poly(phosphoribitol) ligase subunit DltA n=1 Tax=Macrococcoides canis TaxID=1855823 RepID=UPI001B8C7E60|nr:D-alanine--poly(phosphoribitol) ligase subunit DltA [Macrococcus canis]QUR93927.1 D-alanine--poly(phosphoribitol) ligase subunit DltA [Macrococcus canis]UTH07549.1 D-alanine--poly(phosphoribitol) ligase subunit DltA [Macrococcus canis]
MKFLDRFKYTIIQQPDAIAFIHREEMMTYRSLDLLSDDLAKKIAGLNKPLIVYGHMSKWMIVGMLAALKAGIGYVPIDISIPKERIDKIIESVQPEMLFATEKLDTQVSVIVPEEIQEASYEYHGIDDEDIAYTIFTSGSTGMPKGVQILSRSLDEFTQWMVSLYDKQEHNYWLNQAPLSFDLSVMAVYPALATGSTLVMIDKEMIKKPVGIYETLQKYPMSAWVSTPSFMEMCLMLPEFDSHHHPNLKYFYLCGEALKHKTAQNLKSKFKESHIYNTYGPTEATVAITGIEVTEQVLKTFNPLPVGYARPGVTLSLHDDELHIHGEAVSTGYVNAPDKTEAQFYNNGERSYRTGDKGRIEDGLLFIDGRIDFQIKLNGYRMELEEIEHVIAEQSGIKGCIVTPVEKQGKVQYLIAHIVTDNFDEALMKDALKTVLPEYMIPRKFNVIERIPMTANGKVDRKALLGDSK